MVMLVSDDTCVGCRVEGDLEGCGSQWGDGGR